MKTLIVMSAIPGSGKSTWANEFKNTHDNVYIISSDEIRKELTGSYQIFTKQKEVWEIFNKRIHEYALLKEDIYVILDAVIDLNKLRKQYVQDSPEYDKHILVLVDTPYDQCKIWNRQRTNGKNIPEDQMEFLKNKWEEPTKDILSLYDEVITYHPLKNK